MRLLLCILILLVPFSASAERRAAFVLGNGVYENAPSLDNPVADARMIAATLEDLGFAVTLAENLTRSNMGSRLSAFLKAEADADITLFYYAGHGMQFEGENYLIGTDADLQSEFDIEDSALSLDRVTRLFQKGSRAALLFIDACRDNPLADRFYRENFSDTRALASRGLAAPSAGYDGAMTVFAASPGQVAFDGTDGNSPFAAALARHLPAENVEVLSLMKRVIRDVRRATGEAQVPTVTNDLTREIYLKLSEGGAGHTLALEQEQAMFEAALAINSERGWDIFLDRHPNGTMRDMAIAAREALQVEDIATSAGVRPSDLSPDTIARDLAAGIEADLGLSVDDNRAVQAALNRLGYDAGPVDGVVGSRTRRALASFQLAVGLQPTGVVTAGTAEELGLILSRTEEADRPIASSRDARRYDPDKLALIESDPRLIKAARSLAGKEFRYGFFEGSLYLAVLDWHHPTFDRMSRDATVAGGYVVTIGSAAENAFVARLSLADERLWSPNSTRTSMFGPVIGLHQLPNSREPAGGWVWMNGERPSYSSWHPNEPTNHNNNESIALFFVPYDEFAQYRSNPRPLVWGDVSGSYQSYIIEID